MPSFYELAFPDVAFSATGETVVLCPFPHTTQSGEHYFETRPSMNINIEKGIHHCFACGAKGNELSFISQLTGMNKDQALKLKTILENTNETILDWQPARRKLMEFNPDRLNEIIDRYKFSKKAIDQLQIGMEGPGMGFSYPVFLFGRLVDVIRYTPGQTPKYHKRTNSQNGIIMPYDSWKVSKRKHTLICAGQKDLAIALSNDLNAIAITGGEGDLPYLFTHDFIDRTVFIVYDNDDTGRQGAINVAVFLKPYVKSIKIIDISPTCTEKGEDLWDYFVKYKKTKADLLQLINDTPEFTEDNYLKEKEKRYPTVTLAQAERQENIGKMLRSNIQVVAINENRFLMPVVVHATKMKEVGDDAERNQMRINEKRYWNYTPENVKDMLYLIDNNLKETKIIENLHAFTHTIKELGVRIDIDLQETVYKAVVTDYVEAGNTEKEQPVEYNAYALKKPLESGSKYKITYKLVPNPQCGNALVMVIFDVEESQDTISKFKINTDTIEELKKFQIPENSNLEETINNHVQKLKGIVHADYDEMLLKIIDLWYNTPLKFNMVNQKGLCAFLDACLVAESRTGKSSTVEALQRVYGLGTIIPMNGHNSTVAGIMGGSQKTNNGYQTRAGILPRSHGGAVIFEELAKADKDLMKELTEVRSAHRVMLTRVNGTIELPAFVRMLALSNTRAVGATPRPIASYSNGIEILVDLVGTAEDIARYDLIAILPSRGATRIDPNFKPQKPFSEKAYQSRIRWIWSRKSEQVQIEQDIYGYAVERANDLNKTYDSYIKIFGTEAHIKILRLAIAIAGYVVSTNETFEKIIVTREHIDYAINMLVSLYDNPTFRFKQFVEAERKYRDPDEHSVNELQYLWNQSPALLLHLEEHSTTSKNTLQAVSGSDNSVFGEILNKIVSLYFVRFSGQDIIPTERFRKAMLQIDRVTKSKVIRI